jgi:tRNA dimethylallyltransferase
MPSPKLPLIVILGPTAVGKTNVSIALAKKLDGEIVSADSRLFYRGLDIGTAKPSQAEMEAIPHHLIDILDADEEWSLAEFQNVANVAINAIHAKNKLPFLVGGSGQYIRAITQGWLPPSVPANPALRHALEQWGQAIGVEALHAKLARIDPQVASRMDQRNMRRIVRAFEVIYSSGRLFSEQSRQKTSPYSIIQIGLIRNRESLYQRIDKRLDTMLSEGWENEVMQLLASGLSPALPSMSAIGYAQFAQVEAGELTRQEAIQQVKKKSRAFVRHQANWFKKEDPLIKWFDQDTINGVDSIEAHIRNKLEELNNL